jgi:DNA-binding LacI/PurR family transcriptional regulator
MGHILRAVDRTDLDQHQRGARSGRDGPDAGDDLRQGAERSAQRRLDAGDIDEEPAGGTASPTADAESTGRGHARRGPRRGAGPRLVDVARSAGVSPQTVSNVLGNRSGFTPETRERVLRAVRELDYTPNRAAQRLRSQRSGQLGLHLPGTWLSIREPFAISFLRSATEAAERAGQQLVVFTTPLDKVSVTGLVRSGVDGFVLCNVGEEDPRPHIFNDLGIPFALMGRLDPHLPQYSVDIDNAAAMALPVDHLVDRGHEHFAYVGFANDFYVDSDRLAGARARLHHHGLALAEADVLSATIDTVAEEVSALLDRSRPDAIICSGDSLAIRVMDLIRKRGLTPGLDIAITGFDGLPLPFDLDPPLTTVRLPIDAATEEVTRLLLRRIDGAPAPRHGIIIPADLQIGGTT